VERLIQLCAAIWQRCSCSTTVTNQRIVSPGESSYSHPSPLRLPVVVDAATRAMTRWPRNGSQADRLDCASTEGTAARRRTRRRPLTVALLGRARSAAARSAGVRSSRGSANRTFFRRRRRVRSERCLCNGDGGLTCKYFYPIKYSYVKLGTDLQTISSVAGGSSCAVRIDGWKSVSRRTFPEQAFGRPSFSSSSPSHLPVSAAELQAAGEPSRSGHRMETGDALAYGVISSCFIILYPYCGILSLSFSLCLLW
jgi:hypothetical protein